MRTPLLLFCCVSLLQAAERQFENLDRALIATRANSNTVAISWRMLRTDSSTITFNLSRETQKLNSAPLSNATFFLDTNAPAAIAFTYKLESIASTVAPGPVTFTLATNTPPYLSIRLQTPEGYSPNDGSVGDLD